MTSIALVTCSTLPDLDPDDQPLLELLRARGCQAQAKVWDDPNVNWTQFDLAVIRNTWDYPARRTEFVHWACRVPRLANPADVIAWNTDKGYLSELAAAGVPTVPTTWLAPDDVVVLPAKGRFVLKPSIGAGSLDAAAFSMHDEHEGALAREHAARLLAAGRTVMVQPYMDAIEKSGEAALIFLGNQYSHAITKGAMLAGRHDAAGGGLFLAETITAREPTGAELSVAHRALSLVPGGPDALAYARVDLVPDANGDPLLIELELTEPSLYLAYGDGAADRFATVLAKK